MEKVIKDGMVAVCYSPSFGAGWSTWADDEFGEVLVFHPKIVNKVLAGESERIDDNWLVDNFGENFRRVYCGGASNLTVKWLKEGTLFKIDEYDGAESIFIITDETIFRA